MRTTYSEAIVEQRPDSASTGPAVSPAGLARRLSRRNRQCAGLHIAQAGGVGRGIQAGRGSDAARAFAVCSDRRYPVREAVKRLISEGAFEALPNRSARVPLLDRRRDPADPRSANHCSRAMPRRSRRRTSRCTRSSGCARCTSRMGAAVGGRRQPSYGELNMAFHFEIYRIADNKTLATLDRGAVAAHGSVRLAQTLAHHRAIRRRHGPSPADITKRCWLALQTPRRRGGSVGDAGGFVGARRKSTAIGKALRTSNLTRTS